MASGLTELQLGTWHKAVSTPHGALLPSLCLAATPEAHHLSQGPTERTVTCSVQGPGEHVTSV